MLSIVYTSDNRRFASKFGDVGIADETRTLISIKLVCTIYGTPGSGRRYQTSPAQKYSIHKRKSTVPCVFGVALVGAYRNSVPAIWENNLGEKFLLWPYAKLS